MLISTAISTTFSCLSVISEIERESRAELARIAILDVALVQPVRRLVGEVEAAHGVVLIEQVARVQRGLPALLCVAHAHVYQLIRLGALIVAGTEVESIHSLAFDLCEPASGASPLGRQAKLVIRRMRRIATGKIS